jgi:hypothetical protein
MKSGIRDRETVFLAALLTATLVGATKDPLRSFGMRLGVTDFVLSSGLETRAGRRVVILCTVGRGVAREAGATETRGTLGPEKCNGTTKGARFDITAWLERDRRPPEDTRGEAVTL